MTTDITELAPAMKAAVEKTSSGDWVKESGDGWDAICSNDDQANGGFIIAHFAGPDSASNREFMQLANPVNVIALVDALEKAQRANAAQDDHISQQQDRINQLEKRNSELGKRLRGTEESLIASTDMVAELESRTVKLPPAVSVAGIDVYEAGLVRILLTAAGIKWEAE